MLERPITGVRPNGGAFLFTGLGCHPLSPGKERLSGHFHSLCGPRALLFNTEAIPAASCCDLLHPSPGQFSLFLQGRELEGALGKTAFYNKGERATRLEDKDASGEGGT